MKKSTKFVIAFLIVICLLGINYLFVKSGEKDRAIAKYDEKGFIDANSENGQIPDHIIGNKDAKVKIIEYADYQCSACAVTYPYIHSVIEEYGDKVAYIFRTYVLSYHQNGTAAASAAAAAGLQGYWDKYSQILFARQNEWASAKGLERDQLLEGYLTKVATGQVDLQKFRDDIKSTRVKDKISFDRSLANRIKVSATPTIKINNEDYTIRTTNETALKADIRSKIDAALEKVKD